MSDVTLSAFTHLESRNYHHVSTPGLDHGGADWSPELPDRCQNTGRGSSAAAGPQVCSEISALTGCLETGEMNVESATLKTFTGSSTNISDGLKTDEISILRGI